MLNNRLIGFFIIVFVFLGKYDINAQYFAPVGAEWYYKGNPFLSSYGIGYVRFGVEKDTIIDGYECSKITGKEYRPTGDTLDFGPDFLRYDNGKVYYHKYGQFRLMYDFTQNVGDTLEVFNYSQFGGDSLSYLVVDSIYYADYGGEQLKTYIYTPLEIGGGIQYFGPVVERIGDLFWLYPQYGVLFDSEPGHLRCYIDSNMYYNRSVSGTTPCDEYFQNPTKIDEYELAESLEIYPNPTDGSFSIKNTSFVRKVSIFDISGKLLKELKNKSQLETMTIDISDLPKGFYYVILKADNGQKNLKIVKN